MYASRNNNRKKKNKAKKKNHVFFNNVTNIKCNHKRWNKMFLNIRVMCTSYMYIFRLTLYTQFRICLHIYSTINNLMREHYSWLKAKHKENVACTECRWWKYINKKKREANQQFLHYQFQVVFMFIWIVSSFDIVIHSQHTTATKTILNDSFERLINDRIERNWRYWSILSPSLE